MVNKNKETAKKKHMPGKTKKKIDPTMQSLLSVFIFALGLSAIIAVMYLGYVRYIGPDVSDNEVSQKVQNLETEKTKMPKRNLRKASFEQIIGRWKSEDDLLSAFVTVNKTENFQITLFMDPDGFERRFTRGKVSFDAHQGVLKLEPSFDPLPESDVGVIRTLTRRPYAVVALYDPDDQSMYWVPHVIKGRRDQVHPLFNNLKSGEDYIHWLPRND